MYIHRYNADTLSVLEKKYAIPYYEQLKTELAAVVNIHKSSNGAEKTGARRNISRIQTLILEMEGFLQQIHILAAEKITLDLDDGIKNNYEKLKEILE